MVESAGSKSAATLMYVLAFLTRAQHKQNGTAAFEPALSTICYYTERIFSTQLDRMSQPAEAP